MGAAALLDQPWLIGASAAAGFFLGVVIGAAFYA